jgi:ABC-type uncharacterized transport system substrate-binding protein
MMKRREFITLLGGATTAWPIVARAQQPAIPVIGFLSARSPNDSASIQLVTAFKEGLQESGFIDRQNIAIEWRWAEGRYERLTTMAGDLVSRQVAVIAAISGTPAALAVKSTTSTIPIVFANGGDPVASGLVSNIKEPNANLTGATFFNTGLIAKRLELMREIVPTAKLFGLLVNQSNPLSGNDTKNVESAARGLGVEVLVFDASRASEIDTAFTKFAERRVGGLIIASDPWLTVQRAQIAVLAAHYRIPIISPEADFVPAGGLISYATSPTDAYRQAGNYVGRIVKGAKPAELPVQFPTKFHVAVNLRTARALGLTMPTSILLVANEVIE